MKKYFIFGSLVLLLAITLGLDCNKKTTNESIDTTAQTNNNLNENVAVRVSDEMLSTVTIVLETVGEYEGSGSASRKVISDTFVHSITADLTDPAEDKFYEGWLVKTGTTNFFSTGKLEKLDDKYLLSYSADYVDQDEFDQVVVTEETLANGLDDIPEVHVLEGSF
ncbi:hypothetical protein KKG41_06325 [Patescibacteria group bacterium]|nr:hypothetical protein [Patescibacteria group bacterium]